MVASLAATTGAARAEPTYSGGGFVLTSPVVHLILWTPTGGPQFPAVSSNPGGWGGLAEQFLTDVADDSGVTPSASAPNIFTVMQQYYGLPPGVPEARSIAYDMTFDGGFVDAQPYPSDPSCNDSSPAVSNAPCLADSDLRAEVERVIAAQGNPDNGQDVWAIATPPGVDVCFDGGCSLNTGTAVQCGYHNFPAGSGHPLYVVVPYARSSCIGSGQQGPSDNIDPVHSADATLNVLAREIIDAITDPTDNGWKDQGSSPPGFEIGDECANASGGYQFGPAIPGHSDTNQVINGHGYWLQEIWSNASGGAGACAASLDWPLHASYSPPSASAPTGTPVAFDGSPSTDTRSGGTIVDWRWDFGDGSATTSGQSVSHAFAQAGTYRVTLTAVDNSSGTSTGTPPATNSITHTVTISDRPPNAAFTFAPASPVAGQAVAFDGSGSADPDGTVASYAWDFGDGGTAAGATPSHTFAAASSYPVRLTVTDNDGNTGAETQTVVVGAAVDGGGGSGSSESAGAGAGAGAGTTGPAAAPASSLTPGGTVRVRNRRATFAISCPSSAQEACAGTVTVSTASKVVVARARRILVLGHSAYSVAPGRSARVTVRISAAGMRLLARGRRLRVVVRLVDRGTTSDTAGQSTTTSRVVTLALAPRSPKRRRAA